MVAKTILLVEDNADDEALTVRALKKSGVANDIVVARDGQEAVDWLFGEGAHQGRDTTQQPQLMLLDLNLPKLDGEEVLQRLRNDPRTKHLSVVILTTSNEQKDMIRTYDSGANSYVRKPVDFGQFSEAVRQLGLYWLVLNESTINNCVTTSATPPTKQ